MSEGGRGSTPAARLRGAGPLAAIAVTQPHHVVQLRRRNLEHLAIVDRLERVNLARDVPPGVSGTELDGGQPVLGWSLDQKQPAREHVGALVLALVELQRQAVARFDVQDLAGVRVSERPPQLVTPRLLHLVREVHTIPRAGIPATVAPGGTSRVTT